MSLIDKAAEEGKEPEKKKRASLVERFHEKVDPPAGKKSGGIGSRGIGSRSADEKTEAAPAGLSQSKAGGIGSARDPSAMGARTGRGESEAATDEVAEATGSKSVGIGAPEKRGIGSADQRGKGEKTVGLTQSGPHRRNTADKLADKAELLKPKPTPVAPAGATPAPAATANTADSPPVQPASKASPAKASPAKTAEAKTTASTKTPSKPAVKRREVEDIDLQALREAGYITPDMPPNVMAEEFRIIKRSLVMSAFARGDRKIENGNVIMVTSSNPSEGKSFCAINLALSIATEQDVTVLLIDADFSKPEILNRLGVSGGRGLMDVVADKEFELAACLVRTSIPNLVLLPAGRQHNLTTELLASDRMREIVTEISTRYPDRIVIFDSPPVLASSAASVLALYMGQTVFVIEAEKTTEPQIKESLDLISGCDNISLVLNKTRFGGGNKKFATYYGYGGR